MLIEAKLYPGRGGSGKPYAVQEVLSRRIFEGIGVWDKIISDRLSIPTSSSSMQAAWWNSTGRFGHRGHWVTWQNTKRRWPAAGVRRRPLVSHLRPASGETSMSQVGIDLVLAVNPAQSAPDYLWQQMEALRASALRLVVNTRRWHGNPVLSLCCPENP